MVSIGQLSKTLDDLGIIFDHLASDNSEAVPARRSQWQRLHWSPWDASWWEAWNILEENLLWLQLCNWIEVLRSSLPLFPPCPGKCHLNTCPVGVATQDQRGELDPAFPGTLVFLFAFVQYLGPRIFVCVCWFNFLLWKRRIWKEQRIWAQAVWTYIFNIFQYLNKNMSLSPRG